MGNKKRQKHGWINTSSHRLSSVLSIYIERIGCANNTMSGVMSERGNDERQRGGHVGSYNLSKKPPFSDTK